MKLASLKWGRDGRLVVVSTDLAWCVEATNIAPSLQAAIEFENLLRTEGYADSTPFAPVPIYFQLLELCLCHAPDLS